MRSFKLVRFACAAALVSSLFVGAVSIASAQDVTPEATSDMMMQEMMNQPGACPQGEAATLLNNMMGMTTGAAVMGSTEEAPMIGATEEMGMTSTEEAPMMNATEDMGMTGTQEATTMGVTCLYGEFSGAAEVPGPGASNATGVALVSVDPSSGNICYEVAVANITLPAQAMHIHVNAAGQSGDIVVPFPSAPDANGMASGCTTTTVAGLASEIASNPAGYYVNVHTSDFPKGAARAQLESWQAYQMNAGMNSSMMTPEVGNNMVTPVPTTSG